MSVNSTGVDEKDPTLEGSEGQESLAKPSSPPTIIENVESIASNATLVGGSGEGEGEEEGDRKVSSPMPEPVPKTSTPEVQRNPQSSPFLSGRRRFALEVCFSDS